MKNIIFPILISAILIGCSHTQKLNTQEFESVSLMQFTDNSEKYSKTLFETKRGLIIKVPAGTSIPIDLQMNVHFAEFIQGKNYIKFKNDTYLFIQSDKILISADKIKWAPIHDLSAIKEIYKIRKGSISLGFAATKEKGAYIHFIITAEDK